MNLFEKDRPITHIEKMASKILIAVLATPFVLLIAYAILFGKRQPNPQPADTPSAEQVQADLQKQQQAEAHEAKYRQSLQDFVDNNLSKQDDVVKVEIVNDSTIWVTVTGERSDYEARVTRQKMHQAFAAMRLRYFSESDAKICSLDLMDDTGKQLAGGL